MRKYFPSHERGLPEHRFSYTSIKASLQKHWNLSQLSRVFPQTFPGSPKQVWRWHRPIRTFKNCMGSPRDSKELMRSYACLAAVWQWRHHCTPLTHTSSPSKVGHRSEAKPVCPCEEQLNHIKTTKHLIHVDKARRDEEKFNYVKSTLNQQKQKLLEAITEKGASNWLTTLPLKDHGFYLNKQVFWDSISMRYGLPISRLPAKCACDHVFNVEHALSCKTGGFVNIRHNDLRDFTAEALNEVCNDVSVEPLLAPCTGETFTYKSAITEDFARLDVSARGFWIKGNRAFCDVRVFNPLAPTYRNQTLKAAHTTNENAKKREYGERVLNVEHGTLTPLVFTCFGGMSIECSRFYNRLSEKISEKRGIEPSVAKSWVRTKINFSLLKTMNLCLRGSRSRKPHTDEELADTNIKMAMVDARIEWRDCLLYIDTYR